MKKKMIAVSMATLMLLVISASVTEAGCFRRSCVCYTQTQILTVKVEKLSSFSFASIADFTMAAGAGDAAQAPCGTFAIKVAGEDAVLALFEGEKVRLSVDCNVQLPSEYIDGLEKAGCTFNLLKPVSVTMESTLDAEGYAVFNRADVINAVTKKLKKIRFWDCPVIFGLEEMKIKITGAAKLSNRVLKSTNSFEFTGLVK